MSQCHTPLVVVDKNGLYVVQQFGTGGGIANMPYSNVARSERFQTFRAENFTDQSCITVKSEDPAIVYDDTCALLSPVLQGIKAIVGKRSHFGTLCRKNAEYAAFLTDVFPADHMFGFFLTCEKLRKGHIRSPFEKVKRDKGILRTRI